MKTEEILARLVKFNTIRDKEVKELVSFVREFLAPFGFSFRDEGGCLVATRGQKNEAKIGFLGHMDTVAPGEQWRTDPWVLTEDGDKLLGLGACDMKGGIAAFLAAAAQTTEPVKIYLTYDEEIGFGGVLELIKAKEQFPEIMVFAEPTGGEPRIAGKGLLKAKLEFHGVRVHSSRPDKGVNAIYKAVDFITDLREFAESLQSRRDERFSIPYTTMNVGLIGGGDAINTTPEKCWLTVDFRTVSLNDQTTALNKLTELSEKFEADAEILEDIKPFSNEIRDEKVLNILGNKFGASNGMTEASLCDVKCRIIMGPGSTAHEANEFVSRNALNEIAEIYKKLIKC